MKKLFAVTVAFLLMLALALPAAALERQDLQRLNGFDDTRFDRVNVQDPDVPRPVLTGSDITPRVDPAPPSPALLYLDLLKGLFFDREGTRLPLL